MVGKCCLIAIEELIQFDKAHNTITPEATKHLTCNRIDASLKSSVVRKKTKTIFIL